MNVYVLVGGDGAYSDRNEDPVMVFEDEAAATSLCAELNAIADAMRAAVDANRKIAGYYTSVPMEEGIKEPYRASARALGVEDLDEDYCVAEVPMVQR